MEFQNPYGPPRVGDPLLIKGVSINHWFDAVVTSVQGEHFTTGSGMGTRAFKVSDYGKKWKWPVVNRFNRAVVSREKESGL